MTLDAKAIQFRGTTIAFLKEAAFEDFNPGSHISPVNISCSEYKIRTQLLMESRILRSRLTY